MDIDLAVKFYNDSKAFKASIDYCAERQRRVRNGVMKVRNLRLDLKRRGEEFSVDDMAGVLELLSQCGWGDYQKGRPKEDSRLATGARDIVEMASEIADAAIGNRRAAAKLAASQGAINDTEIETHFCPIRRGVQQELRLRADLTSLELENLARFVSLIAASRKHNVESKIPAMTGQRE